VGDIDRFYAEKKENGIEFTFAPTELFGSRIARFKDSEELNVVLAGNNI